MRKRVRRSRCIGFLWFFLCLPSSSWGARPVYSSPVWYDGDANGALPRAIGRGILYYKIERDDASPRVDLEFDFETAAYVWLQALAFHRVALVRTESREQMDVLIHFSPTAYLPEGFRTNAHHYRDPYGARPDEVTNAIELKSDGAAWTSLPEAWDADFKTLTLREGRETPTTVRELFGRMRSSRELARRILDEKPEMIEGELVWERPRDARRSRRVSYWTFLHELGHAWGLADLFVYGDPLRQEKRYRSVMSNPLWRPLLPTPVDVARVRRHIAASGLIPR